MKIIITGGAGSLGKAFVKLLHKDHKVICIDSLLYVDRILKTFNFTEKNWNSKNWGSFGDKKIVIDYLQKNHNNIFSWPSRRNQKTD